MASQTWRRLDVLRLFCCVRMHMCMLYMCRNRGRGVREAPIYLDRHAKTKRAPSQAGVLI